MIRPIIAPKTVSERLGHADVGFTLRTYTHLYDEQREEAVSSGLLNKACTVEVYVTRSSGASGRAAPASIFAVDDDDDGEGEQYEMQENEQLLSMEEQMERPRKGMTVKSGRPKMSEVVDEDEGRTWADGNIRMGDYILLVDSDTRVPITCIVSRNGMARPSTSCHISQRGMRKLRRA